MINYEQNVKRVKRLETGNDTALPWLKVTVVCR